MMTTKFEIVAIEGSIDESPVKPCPLQCFTAVSIAKFKISDASW